MKELIYRYSLKIQKKINKRKKTVKLQMNEND